MDLLGTDMCIIDKEISTLYCDKNYLYLFISTLDLI